jgi:hypothetical protein
MFVTFGRIVFLPLLLAYDRVFKSPLIQIQQNLSMDFVLNIYVMGC